MPGFDLLDIIKAVGYVGLFLIVFAESGVFLGFFFPGDSLLFTAGFLASAAAPGGPVFSLPILILVLTVAAILGVSVGYWTGDKFGRRLFTNEKSFWRNPKRLDEAHAFYEKHGGKALVLARFIPAVRTFVPIAAGMAQMSYPKFLFWNIVGAILWAAGMTAAGYFLTGAIQSAFGVENKDIDKILLPIVAIIIILSVLPAAYHLYQERRGRHAKV
jgi:membrane-associated protein